MKVTLYTMSGCGPCKATRHALESRGVPFDVIDMDADAAARDRVMALGYRTAPVVLVHDGDEVEHWSGFQVGRINDLAGRIRMMEVSE